MAGEDAHLKQQMPQEQTPSRLSELARTLSCKRRTSEEQERQYRALLQRGRSTPQKRKAFYDKLSWWSDAPTKAGSRIFAIAPRGPQGKPEHWIDVWEFVSYCLTKPARARRAREP